MLLYFIAENENGDYDNLRVKIGMSKDINKRLSQLQTGSPYKLKLMGWIEVDDAKYLEKALHAKYKDRIVHGEWFHLGPCDVLKEIKSHFTDGYIAVNGNAFEIVSRDRDGVPEYLGAWQWTDVEYEEFCPKCGWGGGLDYNDNYGGMRCLKCGVVDELL